MEVPDNPESNEDSENNPDESSQNNGNDSEENN